MRRVLRRLLTGVTALDPSIRAALTLTRVRSEQRVAQNAFCRTGSSRRDSENSEPRAVEIRQTKAHPHPCARFLHDTATTVPRHTPSFFALTGVATDRERRRCVRPTSATRIIKDGHPCIRYLPMPSELPRLASVSCAVHADATRFGSSQAIYRGRIVPTAEHRCESPLAFRRCSAATKLVGTPPRNQGCFCRRLVKNDSCLHPETPSTDNRTLTSSGTHCRT